MPNLIRLFVVITVLLEFESSQGAADRAARFLLWQSGKIALQDSRRMTDFSGLQLAAFLGVDLDLRNLNFTGADLTGARFIRDDLRGCDFRRANMTEALIVACDLRGAKFNSTTRLPFDKKTARELGMEETP